MGLSSVVRSSQLRNGRCKVQVGELNVAVYLVLWRCGAASTEVACVWCCLDDAIALFSTWILHPNSSPTVIF